MYLLLMYQSTYSSTYILRFRENVAIEKLVHVKNWIKFTFCIIFTGFNNQFQNYKSKFSRFFWPNKWKYVFYSIFFVLNSSVFDNLGKVNERNIFIYFCRQDSDIPNPYGRIVPNENPPIEILQQIGYNLKRMSEPMQSQNFAPKRPKLVFE